MAAEAVASQPTERALWVLAVCWGVLFTVKVPPVPEGASLEWQVHSHPVSPRAAMLGRSAQLPSKT